MFYVQDVYSRRLWLRRLKSKDAATVENAVRDILNSMNKEVHPKQGHSCCDKGLEFRFSDNFIERFGITIKRNQSYTPFLL